MTSSATTCWVAGRLVRQHWPSTVERTCLPILEICDKRYKIILRPGSDTESINQADLRSLADAESHQYTIPSDDGLIFIVVGPEGQVPIRLRWGLDPSGIALVTAFEHNQPIYAALSVDMNAVEPGWCTSHLPLVASFGNDLPKAPRSGRKAKAAIEVCTFLRWVVTRPDGGRDYCMEARLEHHLARRVAWAGWWQKPSTKGRTLARGYAGEDPCVLAAQTTAAKGWMFATAEVMLDSQWAQGQLASRLARVKLMGFETNNPLHDDHEGLGGHWHPTVRHIPTCNPNTNGIGNGQGHGEKYPCFAPCADPTPHLYLDEEGKCDVTGGRHPQQRPATLSARGEVARLEACGGFLEENGAYSFLPMVTLQTQRSQQSQGQGQGQGQGEVGTGWGCLHVRRGFASLKKGSQFQLQNTCAGAVTDKGSLWGLEFLDGGEAALIPGTRRVVVLRSVRCGGCLHVRESAPALSSEEGGGEEGEGAQKWAVFMLHSDSSSLGSQWDLAMLEDGMATLQSRYTGGYLHVRQSFLSLMAGGHKEKVLQLHSNPQSVGSVWRMHSAHESLLPLFQHSYQLSLRRRACRETAEWSCCVDITRSGVPWVSVSVELNSEVGHMSVCVHRLEDGLLAKPPLVIAFDPTTGCLVGTQSRYLEINV